MVFSSNATCTLISIHSFILCFMPFLCFSFVLANGPYIWYSVTHRHHWFIPMQHSHAVCSQIFTFASLKNSCYASYFPSTLLHTIHIICTKWIFHSHFKKCSKPFYLQFNADNLSICIYQTFKTLSFAWYSEPVHSYITKHSKPMHPFYSKYQNALHSHLTISSQTLPAFYLRSWRLKKISFTP